jgi:uncharacterized protein with HEPN domain
VYILHILDSIDAIADFLKNTSEGEFMSNRLKQSAVVREIEIIGEAVKNVSIKLKDKHPEINWRDIAGTRDKVIHHYFGVDLTIVWNIVKLDLPKLKKGILSIKQELDPLR